MKYWSQIGIFLDWRSWNFRSICDDQVSIADIKLISYILSKFHTIDNIVSQDAVANMHSYIHLYGLLLRRFEIRVR